MASINKFIERMFYWCAIANLGYDQSNRWDIRDGGECDCSSLVIFALREAGFDTGSAETTRNLSDELCARGWMRVENDNNPCEGDILLNDANHVGVWIGSGLAQASHDENGNIAGGEAGDQTDRETVVIPYYNYPWNCYLRYIDRPNPKRKKRKMECIIQPNGEKRLVYFNGDRIIPITHPDQVEAIKQVYKQCTGEDIPMFKFGSKKAPWATRLFEVFGGK